MEFFSNILGYYYITVEGLNAERFIETIVKRDIVVKDLKRPDFNRICFKTTSFCVPKLLEESRRLCYNISGVKGKLSKVSKSENKKETAFDSALIQQDIKGSSSINVGKASGLTGYYLFFKRHLGLAFGLLLIPIILVLSTLFVFQIRIYGLETINEQEIKAFLASNNINVGSLKSSVDLRKLENDLMEAFDCISLISAGIYGGSLVINLKEKIETEINLCPAMMFDIQSFHYLN